MNTALIQVTTGSSYSYRFAMMWSPEVCCIFARNANKFLPVSFLKNILGVNTLQKVWETSYILYAYGWLYLRRVEKFSWYGRTNGLKVSSCLKPTCLGRQFYAAHRLCSQVTVMIFLCACYSSWLSWLVPLIIATAATIAYRYFVVGPTAKESSD